VTGAQEQPSSGATSSQSAPKRARRWRDAGGWIGAGLLILLVLIAIFAPFIAPHAPNDGDLMNAKLPPAWLEGGERSFLLGTDGLGQDLLSRIVYGTRVSLTVGFLGALLAVLIGATLGLIGGYYGGAVDTFVTSVTNLILSLPYLVLVIVLATVLGRSLVNVIVLFGVTDAPVFMRLVRGEVLRLKAQPFVEAARALGASDARVIAQHLLPNLMGPLVTLATFEASAMIFYEAGLGFLGLSVPPEVPSWGNMLALGRQTLTVYPWMSVFPGLAIAVTAFAINLLGEWLRDRLDPRR
jgi:ABC-type dipeptide/oligopeptide/nickel transport system permease subunit